MSYFRKEKQFMERRWKDVRVGDFVRVVCNEIVPADLLLLHTSDPKGVCHIETSNLDGETNLKQRRAMSGLCVLVRDASYFWVSFLCCLLSPLPLCFLTFLLLVIDVKHTSTFPERLR